MQVSVQLVTVLLGCFVDLANSPLQKYFSQLFALFSDDLHYFIAVVQSLLGLLVHQAYFFVVGVAGQLCLVLWLQTVNGRLYSVLGALFYISTLLSYFSLAHS